MTKKEFIIQYVLESIKNPDTDLYDVVRLANATWEAIDKECKNDS